MFRGDRAFSKDHRKSASPARGGTAAPRLRYAIATIAIEADGSKRAMSALVGPPARSVRELNLRVIKPLRGFALMKRPSSP
jgi:hypothetical protein